MEYLRLLISGLVSFLLSVFIMPLVISLSRRLKLKQTVLHYVDNHASKSGTPTMGGIGILLAAALSSLSLMTKNNSLMLLVLFVTIAYGIVGFLDDFIKVRFKQNEGLKPYQKIIFQVLIAGAVSVYAYFNRYILASVFVPFTLSEISLGVFSVFLNAIVFLAFTNSVNLTDGLDGLAGKVSVSYLAIFSFLVGILIYLFGGGEEILKAEYINILIFCFSLMGALIGFLIYNGFPAKIFMGDTGSLAIGGALASLAVVTRLTFYVPIIGIMFTLTALSVIIQVGYYKKTKKRIFLMAPLHHHFERKGVHENRIVAIYNAITLAIGFLAIIITLALS